MRKQFRNALGSGFPDKHRNSADDETSSSNNIPGDGCTAPSSTFLHLPPPSSTGDCCKKTEVGSVFLPRSLFRLAWKHLAAPQLRGRTEANRSLSKIFELPLWTICYKQETLAALCLRVVRVARNIWKFHYLVTRALSHWFRNFTNMIAAAIAFRCWTASEIAETPRKRKTEKEGGGKNE